jgi:hypothetical protein
MVAFQVQGPASKGITQRADKENVTEVETTGPDCSVDGVNNVLQKQVRQVKSSPTVEKVRRTRRTRRLRDANYFWIRCQCRPHTLFEISATVRPSGTENIFDIPVDVSLLYPVLLAVLNNTE